MRREKGIGRGWLMAGVGVLIVVLGMLGVEAVMSFSQKKWDGETRFTVVDVRGPVSVLSIDPGDTQVTRLLIPDELEIPTVGRGRWTAKAIPELAKKYGTKWAADSISAYMGIPFIGVMGNLGFWDEISFRLLTRGMTVNEVDMSGTSWLSKKTAPDGQVTYDLTSLWKKKAGEMFFSSVLAIQGWELSVVNPTGVAGLGAKLARIAETAGFKVIALSEGKDKPEKCIIQGQSTAKESLGINWLNRTYGCEFVANEDLATTSAVLILGDEFSGWGD